MEIPCCFEAFEHFPKLLVRHRIDARSGFIQKKHAGLVNQNNTKPVSVSCLRKAAPGFSGFKQLNLLVNILNEMIVFLNGCFENRCKRSGFPRPTILRYKRKLTGHIPYRLRISEIADRIGSRRPSPYRPAGKSKVVSMPNNVLLPAPSGMMMGGKSSPRLTLKGDVLQSRDLTVTLEICSTSTMFIPLVSSHHTFQS